MSVLIFGKSINHPRWRIQECLLFLLANENYDLCQSSIYNKTYLPLRLR